MVLAWATLFALLIIFDLVETLDDEEQFFIHAVKIFITGLVLDFTEQEIFKRCHTCENSISELIHEGNFIVLHYDDSFLQCIKELTVGVTLYVK